MSGDKLSGIIAHRESNQQNVLLCDEKTDLGPYAKWNCSFEYFLCVTSFDTIYDHYQPVWPISAEQTRKTDGAVIWKWKPSLAGMED